MRDHDELGLQQRDGVAQGFVFRGEPEQLVAQPHALVQQLLVFAEPRLQWRGAQADVHVVERVLFVLAVSLVRDRGDVSDPGVFQVAHLLRLQEVEHGLVSPVSQLRVRQPAAQLVDFLHQSHVLQLEVEHRAVVQRDLSFLQRTHVRLSISLVALLLSLSVGLLLLGGLRLLDLHHSFGPHFVLQFSVLFRQ